jgi:3-deoxy-D-manno-octulosonic-acid transferase
MISAVYRCLTELGAPVIRLYLRRRLAAGREDAARFGERLGQASAPRPQGFLIWCHAASVGEAASLLALIHAMRAQYPAASILMTTGTVTSARMLENRLPPGVIHQYMPVDRLPYVRGFLDHWRPDLALWIESELWPNMLEGLRERRIPAVLLNGRMSDKSFRQWYRVRGWAKEILGTFSLCLTQTEAERGRFVTLGARPVRCIGNLKYAAAPLPCDMEELESLRAHFAGREVWLMASTHRGEEEIAGEVHKRLKKTRPTLLTVIVPRHAARGDEIAARLTGLGLKVAQRSKGETATEAADIYLADTMGESGLFYRLAPIVVMGGSFAAVGGHNPVEPARLGGALILGPSMFNFSEITREFLFQRAALQVQHANELGFTINRLMDNPAERQALALHARILAEDKQHVLDDILRELEPWLPRDSGFRIQDSGT